MRPLCPVTDTSGFSSDLRNQAEGVLQEVFELLLVLIFIDPANLPPNAGDGLLVFRGVYLTNANSIPGHVVILSRVRSVPGILARNCVARLVRFRAPAAQRKHGRPEQGQDADSDKE